MSAAETRLLFTAALHQMKQSVASPLLVELRIGKAADFPEARDMAYTEEVRPGHYKLVVRPRFHEQPAHRQKAVLAHELAHATLMEHFGGHSERQADRVAETIFRLRIYYDSEGVQTIDSWRGTSPRPGWLPQ